MRFLVPVLGLGLAVLPACICMPSSHSGPSTSDPGTGMTGDPGTGSPGTGKGGDVGAGNCLGGELPEVCDGTDNDCDGLIDEGGVCPPPPPGCLPSPELCDGMDNDCDELVDEGGVCTPPPPPPGCTPSTEVCDGADNNCNGVIDDGIGGGGPCFSSCGLGFSQCVNGSWDCVVVLAPPESCNGMDDNCDGDVDEGSFPCPCTAETGMCSGGTLTGCSSLCVPGAVRWCDDATYCNWGQQTCQSNGAWGPCIETPGSAPPGCSTCDGNAGDFGCYDQSCCVASGSCCEDFNAGSPSGTNPSVGDCSAECT